MLSRLALVAALLASCPQMAIAQRLDSLSSADADTIGNQIVVMRQWPVDGSPWPRVRLYRFIDASPVESAGMLGDYEHQQDYIKDLDESRIVRRPDSTHAEVFFRYSAGLRFLPSATYTVLEELAHEPGSLYVISWRLVSGSKLKRVEGSARFAAWKNPVTGRDGTLLVYDQLVVPGFMGSGFGFVRNRALDDMRGAVDAIAMEVERERMSDKTRLDRQVAAVRAALGVSTP